MYTSMSSAIQDITNPDLTNEERARLRKERREKRGQQTDGRLSPQQSSKPFRTHSPTIRPSHSPNFGYPSEYGYNKSFSSSPRNSPSPTHKRLSPSYPNSFNSLHSVSDQNDSANLYDRGQSISELVDTNLLSAKTISNGTIAEPTHTSKIQDETLRFPRHTPVIHPHDSRTPRLSRGAVRNTNIVYRKDLDDFSQQDITVVMFPRDTGNPERPQDLGGNLHELLSHETSSDEAPGKGGGKRGMMIVPSEPSRTAANVGPKTDKTPSKENGEKDDEKQESKQSRKVSKRFSFLAKKEDKQQSKEKGNEKKSPKIKKKKSSSRSKLSSGGLSMLSMPNLHYPDEDESLSPESPNTTSPNQSKTKYSIFRRKQDKKSNLQRTSWKFQQPTTDVYLQPTVSLQNIMEVPGEPPTYDMVIGRTVSMEFLSQENGNEFNPLITVFRSHTNDDFSDEDDVPSSSNFEATEDSRNDASSSPVSMASITIEIPDLPVDTTRCNATPLPTPNEITGTSVAVAKEDPGENMDGKSEKKEELKSKEGTPGSPEADDKEGNKFTRNMGSRKPLRRQSATGKESPFNRRKPSSLRATPESTSTSPSMSVSPSKFSLSSNSSYGGSPRTTPTNQRKKIPSNSGSPVQARYTTKRVSQGDGTPTNSPKSSSRSTPLSFRSKRSPANSPTSSPALSRKTSGKKSPLVSSNSTQKSNRSSVTVSSPKLKHKSTEIPSKKKSDAKSKPGKLMIESPATVRRRKIGIISPTSPLNVANDNVFGEIKQTIVPKRPAPPPPKLRSEMNMNVSEMFSTPSGKNGDPKMSTPVSKHTTTPTKTKTDVKTPRQTYVYENPNRKSSSTQKPSELSRKKESTTYKYTTGSLGKRPGVATTSTSGEASGGGNKSVMASEEKSSGSKHKNVSKATASPSLSTRQKHRNLSAVVTQRAKEVPKVPKKLSVDNYSAGRLSPTLGILNPLDSLLTSSSSIEKLSNDPSSPLIGSMFARPFSPTSPPLSQDEGDISLSPEVPLDGEDKMTYIYRSTLLRKSSRDVKPINRVPSNKSIGSPLHESTSKPLSRTSSPRKMSMPVLGGSPTRQSKRLVTGSPVRKGSLSTQPLSRKSSSGTIRSTVEKVQSGTNTMGRSRSTSQSSIYQSIRRQSKSSSHLSSSLARQSIKCKKSSADSVKSKKPPSGLISSIKSDAPPKPKVDATDGGSGNSKPIKLPTHKPPIAPDSGVKAVKHPSIAALKGHSSSLVSIESKHKELGKSTRTSKSLDGETKAKLGHTQSFPKLSTGNTSGRSSLKAKVSTDSALGKVRSSLRMSRRSSSGTVAKVSQSGSPLHSSMSSSPSHRALTRTLKRDDTLKAFDHVSSMADKTKLSSVADHKRQIRPRTRHKPSPAHLQMLNKRSDVSSELEADKNSDPNSSGVDPNSYATYMGKKKLDKTALAGLAAKLDFTTVKLRKTGIVEEMMAVQNDKTEGVGRVRILDEPQSSYGVQVTDHPQMLLMIKGRKNVQTRLVEPVSASINSGDVFILVGSQDLFLWQGKEANILEKARANDIVNRIHQKRELGCRANGFVHIDDEKGKKVLSKKEQLFWELLKGKPELKKDTNHVPTDESYERGVSNATKVYQYVVDGEGSRFVVVHEDTTQPLKISLLDTKKILLFDFCSEVYVWMGKRCPQAHRKPAMTKARKVYDSGYIPPVFSVSSTPTNSPSRKVSVGRQSGRFRSKLHQKHGTGSIRRRTLERKPSKGDLQERPSWSLFARVNEGSETILFREKFVDWPEPGRIIKMKGHESSGEVFKAPPLPELQPADVQEMLKPRSTFQGLRLEGEDIHRGRGNYKISRSTFACNRVRSQTVVKYLVKDSDNILLPEEKLGVFYSGEGYVLRWLYVITVVRELEGLTPGAGMFAQDRKYQKSVLEKKLQKQVGARSGVNAQLSKTQPEKEKNVGDSSDEDVNESDEESRRVLESGGRDRVAYFFWQGEHASINEKGAAAVITVELDKERAPQIRVTQGKEHPAFLQFFNGSMVILCGKSVNNSIEQCARGYRLYCVLGNAKKEACLLEIDVQNSSLFYYMRSRGCYIIQYKASSSVYVWNGCKATETLKGVAALAGRKLKKRLKNYKVVSISEGSEPNEMLKLMGERTLYHSLLTVPDHDHVYTPRLFHLSSSTGWFIASEETHVAMPDSEDTPDPFGFLQEDLYNATQPTLFLLDADTDIYLWMGWWPVQKNKLLQEKNAFSGLAQSRWAKEKKLGLETALNYADACKRTPRPNVYVVSAGSEHVEFINLFGVWNERKDVQYIVGNTVPTRVSAEKELAKYTRNSYTLQELLKHPEEVDPSKLETYLSDEEFEHSFKMSRDQFSKLLAWKQVDLKKRVGLF